MDESFPIITKRVNSDGRVECHLGFSSDWDGFESIVKYLKNIGRRAQFKPLIIFILDVGC